MEIWSQAISAVEQIVRKYSDEDATDKEIAEAWAGAADWILALFGVPAKNIRREFTGFGNMWRTLEQDFKNRNTTSTSLSDAALDAFWSSIPLVRLIKGETKAEKLLDALIAGDNHYAERLRGTYKTENAANNAVVRVIKERFEDGVLTQAQALEYLMEYAGKPEREAQEYVSEWLAKVETGIEYNDIQVAFVSGEITEQKAVDMCVKYGGYTVEEAQEKVTEWRAEKETGIKYDDIQDAFAAGEISAQKAVDMCVKYGGYTVEEAQDKVTVWGFQADYPNSDLTDGQILKYVEFAEPAGISVDVYTQYVAATADLQADKDAKGNTISGSKRKKVLAAIHRLPLTPKQKDALYFANGYAKSTLDEAPWR